MRWCALVAMLGASGLAQAQPDTTSTKHDDKSDATEAPRAVTSGEAAAGDQAKKAAAARFLDGQRQFNDGHFIDAADEFNAAFALDADPVYLYNSAQAYRRGGACARAADYYRRFLIAVPNPPNLDKVQHYLHDLDACVKAETPTTPETPTTAPTTTPPTTPTQPEAVVKPEPAPLPHADAGSHTLRLAGIATAVGGVAVLGVGVPAAPPAEGRRSHRPGVMPLPSGSTIRK
jgi:tetratricopeptide (TPR) repeat protein